MKRPEFLRLPHLALLGLTLSLGLSGGSSVALAQYPGYPQQGYGSVPGQGYFPNSVYQQNNAPVQNPYQGAPVRNPYQQQNTRPSYSGAGSQQQAPSTPYSGYNQPVPPQFGQNSTPPQRYNTADYETSSSENYVKYSDMGRDYFQKGELTKAIEAYEKALPLAPESSIPVIYNNLAATYIKRGNYFHDNAKQHESGLEDFREAVYWLEYGWPEGMQRQDLHERNLKVAKDNMVNAYRSLGLNPLEAGVHLEAAKKLRLQGKFRQAAVEYARTTELDKENTEAMHALGDLFNVLNQPHKSNKYYEKITTTDSDAVDDDLLVQLGNAQYKAGKIDDAVVSFDKALAKNPGNVAALSQLEKIWLNEIKFNPASMLGHANLAGVYQKQKKYDLAFQQYLAAEHFAEQDPQTSFNVKKLIRLNIGTLSQEQHNYQQAIKAYDTVLLADPNHKLANFYKATALEESGNYQGALDAYNHLLAIDPDYDEAKKRMFGLIKKQTDPDKLALGLIEYANRFPQDATLQAQIGEEFHQMKDFANAEKFYQRAIQINPKLASAYANLGAVYQAQGRDEESLRAYDKAKQLDPKNETVAQLSQNVQGSLAYKYFQEGVEAQEAGDLPAALGHFRKALAITPDNADLVAAYGVALQNSSETDKSIEQYQKALVLAPNNADFHYYLATAYHQKNDLQKALTSYKKAASLDANNTQAREAIAGIEQIFVSQDLNKAIDAFNAKKYPDALTTINKTLAGDPTNATAHYYKGLILSEQKKPDLAIASYRDAVKNDPNYADAYYAMGVLLDGKGNKAQARSAFSQFISLSASNDDDFVRYAKGRLEALSQ